LTIAMLVVCALGVGRPAVATGALGQENGAGAFGLRQSLAVTVPPGLGSNTFPSDAAADSNGNLYVVIATFVQKYRADGTLLHAWGGEGSGDGEFLGPVAIAVDGSDRVYVADSVLNRVQQFTSDGRLLAKWGSNGGDGSAGSGPGEFTAVSDIATAGERVYVLDGPPGDGRVQRFSSAGVPQVSKPTGVSPGSLAAGGKAVFVRPFNSNSIVRLNASTLAGEASLSVSLFDESARISSSCCGLALVGESLWAGDMTKSRLEQFSLSGTFRSACGSPALYSVAHLSPGPGGLLLAVRSGERSVLVFDSERQAEAACDSSAPRIRIVSVKAQRTRGSRSQPRVRVRFRGNEAVLLTVRLFQRLPGRRLAGRCKRADPRRSRGSRCVRLVRRLDLTRGQAFSAQPPRVASMLLSKGPDGKAFPPGRYRLALSARDLAGNVGPTVFRRFKILRREGGSASASPKHGRRPPMPSLD